MADSEQRSAWLRNEVQAVLGRNVESIRWDTLGFNNHLAFVTLVPSSTDSGSNDTVPRPATDEIVVRIPKDKSSNVDPRGKLENEVAALQIARAHGIPCPQVIRYNSDPLYVIQDRLPGTPVKEVWHLMTDGERANLCASLANVMKNLRSISLPGSASSESGYGGFRLGDREPGSGTPGDFVVLGTNPLGFKEPTSSLTGHLRAFFDWQMDLARANPFLSGWAYKSVAATGLEDGQADPSNTTGSTQQSLADRLQAFSSDPDRGLDFVLQKLEKDSGEIGQAVFVHGDFDLHNVLLDQETYKVTGLVDFEFARAAPAWEEHFDGLAGVGHGHSGPEDDNVDVVRHGQALLHPAGWSSDSNPIPRTEQVGKVTSLSGDDPQDVVTWDVVHAWDRACEGEGVLTPRKMNTKQAGEKEGVFALASRLHWFISDVCPWQLEDAKAELGSTGKDTLDHLPDERREWVVRKRDKAAQRLDRFLAFWNF
ncbi:hypothetical protein OC845_004713 [Tilletia horrida]|nr:hypothetical protein OC845_004713 [Tilletia horrida]